MTASTATIKRLKLLRRLYLVESKLNTPGAFSKVQAEKSIDEVFYVASFRGNETHKFMILLIRQLNKSDSKNCKLKFAFQLCKCLRHSNTVASNKIPCFRETR